MVRLVAIIACLALAPTAAAAETVGSGLSAPPDDELACTHTGGCTLAQTHLAGRAMFVTSDGVLVRWRASFPPGALEQQVALTVLRYVDGGVYSHVETAPPAELGAGQQSLTQDVRVPVRLGDRIGITLQEDGAVGVITRPYAAVMTFEPVLGPFQARVPDEVEPGDVELLLNADIEPDRDGDGAGDETQDSCPESGATDGACSQDLLLRPPDRTGLVVGYPSSMFLPLHWERSPAVGNWLTSDTIVTIEAPAHARLIQAAADGHPCFEFHPQRAVCRVRPPPALFTHTSVLLQAVVDPRTVAPATVRAGATFTAFAEPSQRDPNTANNTVTWKSAIRAVRCGVGIRGTGRSDRITGTAYSDRIIGGRGRDVINGRGGRDCVYGGRGRDRLLANDGRRDTLNCGPGTDRARVDRVDRVIACERVGIRRAPSSARP